MVAVARLELERRWTLLPLALAVGFVPFAVMPLVGAPFGETRGLAFLLALLLAAATALLLGAASVAGDLAAGRLDFYFSRPLSWWAIWSGKLATNFALMLAVGVLVLLPSLVFAPADTLWPRPPLVLPIVYGLALIGLVHWGAVAVRARTPWLVLDVVALPVVAWAFSDAVRRIVAEHGYVPTGLGMAMLGLPIVAAIHAAGAVQVAQGRTSPVRSHAAASLTGWTLLALLAGGWQVVSRTGFSIDPAHLDRAYLAVRSPSGDTGLVLGTTRRLGFQGIWADQPFLAGPRGLRPFEDRSGVLWRLAFSGDGSRALWLCAPEGEHALCVHDVASDATDAVALRPQLPPPARRRSTPPRPRLVVDEGGRRVAVLQAGWTSFYDTASGERLALLEQGDGGPVEHVALRQGGGDLVYRSDPEGGLAIAERSGETFQTTGHLPPPNQESWRGLHIDAPGERLLLTGRGEALLADARTGAPLARFEGAAAFFLEGLLLSDGRVLVAIADLAGTSLRLHDGAGVLLDEVDLGAASAVHLVESSAGYAVAGLANPGAGTTAPNGAPGLGDRMAVVGLDPLRLVRVEDGLILRRTIGGRLHAHRDRPAGPTLLVYRHVALEPGRRSALLRYHVETGATEWVAGAR